jgi:hypothetical protein
LTAEVERGWTALYPDKVRSAATDAGQAPRGVVPVERGQHVPGSAR